MSRIGGQRLWRPGGKAGGRKDVVGLDRAEVDATDRASDRDRLLGGYSSNASVTARREWPLRDSDPFVRLTAVQVLPGDNRELLLSNLASVLNDSVRGGSNRGRNANGPIRPGKSHG